MSGAPMETTPQLLGDNWQLIEGARQQASVALGACQTALYWHISRRIHSELLTGERVAYGAQIVATMSRQLLQKCGGGLTEKNLRRMVQFAQTYSEENKIAMMWRQLSWSHLGGLPKANLHEARALSRARLDNRGGEEA